jgi:hypothetical protein
VLYVDQAPASYRLDHLRVEQLRQRHPARLGCGACDLAPWWLHPVPIVDQRGHLNRNLRF